MNLENLFQDLEDQYEALATKAGFGIENVGTLTISLQGRRLELRQLHFAKDFVLGRCRSTLYLIPHRHLGIVEWLPGESTNSSNTLKKWLTTLPEEVWLRIQVGPEQLSGNVHLTQSGLIVLSNKVIAKEAIEYIEIRAVENSQAVFASGATL